MEKPLYKRAKVNKLPIDSSPKYIRLVDGITIKDGFKFGIGFFLASILISIIAALCSALFMAFLNGLFITSGMPV